MKSKTFVLSLLSLIFHHGEAFTQPASTRIHGRSVFFQGKESRSYRGPSSSSSSLQMMDFILPLTMSEFGSTTFDGANSAQMLVSSNQNFESRFFGDLAHLILDFATICSPDTVLLRLLIFIGRIFSILSDYVPDHTMTYDELLFQTTMLVISTNMFVKKFRTTLWSLSKDTSSFKDRRIFKRIFCPAGFTFSQYRSLLSLNVLEWTYFKPGEFIFEDESSILITYKGSIQHYSSTGSNKRFSSSNTTFYACDRDLCYEVIGDITQAHEILESRRKRTASKIVDDFDPSMNSNFHLRAGPSGATLLRINTKALLEVAGEDIEITESTKNLFFNAMQRKLKSYTNDTITTRSQVNETTSHHFL